jgi:hypothetical protein
LESEEEHNDGGADKHKSGKVERLDGGTQDLEGWALLLGFGNCVEQKESADDDAEWKIDIET